MGVQRKRKRREEEFEEEREQEQEERPREKKDATATAPADRALELQKTAGNRAVGAALDRWGLPWIPVTPAPQWPKEAQLIADGTAIPISSWSWADGTPGVGSATGVGRPRADMDITVTTTVGSHSADIALRTADGRPFKTVYIVVPGKDGKGVTIKLENVMITSYQTSGGSADTGPLETFSLSYAKRELTEAPPPRH